MLSTRNVCQEVRLMAKFDPYEYCRKYATNATTTVKNADGVKVTIEGSPERPTETSIAKLAGIETGWLQFASIECTLPSGRRFRYEMSDCRLKVNATLAGVEELACQ